MNMVRVMVAALSIFWISAAFAQPVVVADSGDNGWMLAAAIMTLMTAVPGLALCYSRGRRDQSGVVAFASMSIVSIIFVMIGYSLAFGDGTALLGGTGYAMMAQLPDLQPDMTISGSIYALFELVLAIFAVAVVAGSVMNQTRLGWLVTVSGLWSLIVYVPIAHWIWGGGWLVGLGALDYAGGLVIHVSAGTAALVIAMLLGRNDRTRDPSSTQADGIGAGLLCIGQLAVIGGSSFGASSDAAEAVINAVLAIAGAVAVGLIFERLRTGAVSVGGAATNAIAGVAAVSAGATYIAPAGAIMIGAVGAIGAALAMALIRLLKLGTASTAFAAHGGGAILGSIIFPVFVMTAFGGPGFDDGASVTGQIATQAIATIAVVAWSGIATLIIALMVAVVLPMSDNDASA